MAMNKLILVAVAAVMLVNLPYVFADFTGDIRESSSNLKENTRIIKHFNKIIEPCGDATDSKTVIACDMIYQELNIALSKAYSDTESDFGDIYVDLPTLVIDNWQYKTAEVKPNATNTDVILDSISSLSLMKVIEDLGETCAGSARSYDFSAVKSCISIANALNEHLTEFDDNTKSEFSQILSSGF
jgi:hypothetical protein